MSLLSFPTASPATPLLSLTAVSVDTEATSLDIKTSRIIEIGAKVLINGATADGQSFSHLISPGVTIPKESSAIHGLTDSDVQSASGFAEVYRSFRAFAGPHVWLGFALDFDMGLLARECERHGLAFRPPQSLDVRSLVRILKPTLPDYALETIAQWRGIAVHNRHRALGDAQLTADIYLALVPLLRERGIRTLGEAQAAARRLDEQTTGSFVPAAEFSTPLARIDSYAYRHRVADVMSLPPLKLGGAATLKDAIDMMVERRVSSLFIDDENRGILTERDCLRATSTHGAKSFHLKVKDVASFPLATVQSEDFLHVAIGLMRRKAIRHLGVLDNAGALVGALSQRDLLRLRADGALALTNALSEAATPQELASVWRKLADAARGLLEEDVDARDIAAIISGEVCALTARAATMAEREMVEVKPPGLKYTVIVLGSGGRGESLLALDQDNAIVFTCDDEAAAEAWLAKMGRRMNSILDEVGVPLCKGGVMAMNGEWRKSETGWRQRIEGWLSHTKPSDVMNADIFFDSVAVHGDHALAETLRDNAIAAASESAAFLKIMSLNAAVPGGALKWFGRFSVDEQGRMDLKRLGIMPIFTAARVSALQNRVHERSTRARLASLRGNPEIPQARLESITEAHGVLMRFILSQQLADIAQGIPPSNLVAPASLSAREKERLKWALQQAENVGDLLGTPQV